MLNFKDCGRKRVPSFVSSKEFCIELKMEFFESAFLSQGSLKFGKEFMTT